MDGHENRMDAFLLDGNEARIITRNAGKDFAMLKMKRLGKCLSK